MLNGRRNNFDRLNNAIASIKLTIGIIGIIKCTSDISQTDAGEIYVENNTKVLNTKKQRARILSNLLNAITSLGWSLIYLANPCPYTAFLSIKRNQYSQPVVLVDR